MSDVETVEKIISQGDPWGSMQCGIMIDGFGKERLNPNLEPYCYKGKLPMPLLGMVDDILMISSSGYKTRRLNAFINVKTAVKRLQFGQDKCHVLHVGKKIPEYKKIELFVDGWKYQEVQHHLTGENEYHETFEGDQDIEELNHEKYLGQIISNDGSNVKNVTNRYNKGTGMVNTITSILNYVPGGKYHFEIAVIIRNAYLISSMLSCSEVWYNLSELDLRKLEHVDEALMRNIF